MIPKMEGIEYNSWMSLLNHISSNIADKCIERGLSDVSLDVMPAYPRDLTTLHKPSIIVQKIHIISRRIGMGNVLGQYTDNGRAYDVYGMGYETTYQINVDAGSNTECSIITSALTGGIFNDTFINRDNVVPLNNYLHDVNNPELGIGRMDIIDDIDITPLSSNEDEDYINLVSVRFRTIQSIIDIDQPMVDLSKPIKYHQNVRIKKEE